MQWVIDRFENDIAVLENVQDLSIRRLERKDLPADARQGDVIIQTGEAYRIDHAAAEERRKRIQSRFARLKARSLR